MTTCPTAPASSRPRWPWARRSSIASAPPASGLPRCRGSRVTDVQGRPELGERRRMIDLRTDGRAALDWAADYLERVGDLPVLAQVAPGEIRAAPARRGPRRARAVLGGAARPRRDPAARASPTGSTRGSSPTSPPAPSEPGILAELLAATLNSVGFLWRTAPAATELEEVVLDWTAKLLGLPDGWHGHIEDTASTGDDGGDDRGPRGDRPQRGRLLRAHPLGGREGGADAGHDAAQGPHRRRVPPARRRARRPERGGGRRRHRRHHGQRVGRSGPRDRRRLRGRRHLAARRRRLRGQAMVCPEFRWAFAGVERADSLVVNAHNGCSRRWTARCCGRAGPPSCAPPSAWCPSSCARPTPRTRCRSASTGRRWAAASARSSCGRCCAATAAAACRRTSAAGWRSPRCSRAGWPPSPAGSCARRATSRSSASALEGDDERSKVLLERVNAGGEMFLSHAALGGRYVLRLAIGQMSTTEADVRHAWDVLRSRRRRAG